MLRYNKILPRENKRRLESLREFRKQLLIYFANINFENYSYNPTENKEATTARISINLSLLEMHDIVVAAGISPIMTYSPPPAIGGLIRDIDLIHNVFFLHYYRVSPTCLIDQIERAIGKYEQNKRKSRIRLFNPFFYLSLIMNYLGELPFRFFEIIGLNRTKIESSIWGSIIKGIFQLIFLIAAITTILYNVGYIEKLKNLIR